MKRTYRNLSLLLLALVMVLSLNVTAFAADSTITFKGAEEGFEFQPGSEYTATDLFGNFKDIMPGDRLTETIQVKNDATDCDYIKLYMRAVVHDENGNPLTYSEAFENADGKDQANIDGQRDETVATMQDFLSKLTMRIYNGEQLIFEASPDEAGALINNVLLGTLSSGESLNLKVELDVPIELGNEYANRVGEVDWVFLAECIENEKLTVHKVWDDNGYPDRPDSVIVHLLRDGEKFEEIELNKHNQWTYTWEDLDDRYNWSVKEDVPAGYDASNKTEDNKVFITNYMDYEPVIPTEPVDLTVKKVWSDENDKHDVRPDSVTMTLYNGDTAVEKVTLGEWNDWTFIWIDLDGDGDWSVLETGIPKGYTPSYRTIGDVVTITNTATLIQTGQLSWPIPVMGGLGLALIAYGFIVFIKKRKNKHA
jgi:hypothetical protein